MIKQIHILLTYKCILECDHCFVFSSPDAEGVFTFENLKELLSNREQILSKTKIKGVKNESVGDRMFTT